MALNVRKIGWMALFSLASGCSAQKPPAPGTFIPAISIVAANTKPAGTVIPPPLGKHSRTTCPTSGWVTHGDGHKTRCPQCDPPWEAAPPPVDPVPPIKSYEDAVKAFDAMTDCPSGQCSPSSRAVRNEQYEQPARRGIFGRLRGR